MDYIDTTPPTISASTPTSWGTTNSVNVNISDSGSGVAVQKWAFGKNLPASYFANNGTIFTGSSFNVSQNGDYTIYAVDNAGNASTQDVPVSYVYTPAPIGNFTQSFTDLSVSSPGMNSTFGRVYNSADNSVGPFGRGWTFSYEGSIKNYQYTYTDANGNKQTVTMPNLE